MNKWIYIFAAASLAMAGCSESELLDDTPTSGKAGHVTLTFDVEMPELWATTKTLGEDPKIEDIHVAVFGVTGYLEEYVLATAVGATKNNTKYAYEVELPVYESDCSLDFIANGPDYLSPGYESQVIGELVTSGGQDAYWQRFEIAGGIKTTTGSEGNTVLTSDFIESNGLDDVKLIRNFSRLTVVGSDNFTVESFLLVNEPTMGSIAPYNSGADDIFVSDYLSYGADSYAALSAKYEGFTPAKAGRHTFSESDSPISVEKEKYAYFYEFSSKATEAGPMYLLVNGKYKENGSSWYKILLVDTDGDALSFLRNFGYTVTLNVERQGESSAAAADMTAGTDDFSMVTEDIIEVSDGKGVLSLDYRVKAFTENSDDNETLGFMFKTSDGEYPTGSVKVALVDGDDEIITDLSVTTDNSADGGVISYKVYGLGDRIKKKSFRVTATNGDRQLSLTVTVYLVPQLQMKLNLEPSAVYAKKGSAVTAWIDIPASLPDCLFPLSFAIEAEKRTLSPDASNGYPSLPVETGTSTIKGNNSNSYWFVRTLTEEEYDALSNGEAYEGSQGRTYSDEDGSWVRFDSHFLTNIDASDSKVYASNAYFAQAGYEFTTYTYGDFSSLAFSGDAYSGGKIADGEDNAVTFSFTTTPPSGDVTAKYIVVTLVGLEPVKGSPLVVRKDDSGDVIYDDNGNVTYEYEEGASSGPHTLSFTTTSISDEVAVHLSGTYFDSASLSSERSSVLSWAHVGFTEKDGSYPDDKSNGSVTDNGTYAITDGNFYTGNFVGFTASGDFDFLRKGISYYRLKMGVRKVKYNFEFAYDSEGNLKSGDVTVVLSGGTILTAGNTGTFAVGEDGSYTFTPSDPTTAAQTFYLTSSFADPVSVSISADGYSDDTETMDRAFYVEENALYISNDSSVTKMTKNYSFQVFFLVSDYMATGDASRSISFLKKRYSDISVTSGENRYAYRVGDGDYEYASNGCNANKEHAIDLKELSGLDASSRIYLQCYNGISKYSGTFYEEELTLQDVCDATTASPQALSLEEVKR